MVVSALVYVGYNRINFSPAGGSTLPPAPSGSASTSAIPCDQLEHTQVHYHIGLQILNQGHTVPISTSVGRTAGCLYWLHMHTGESGVIHVEAPANRTFTLGDFFSVWGAWGGISEPLDSTHVSSFTLAGNQKLLVYVDAGDTRGPALFSGDPKSIVLKPREEITLEIAPPTVSPPPPFRWPSGF